MFNSYSEITPKIIDAFVSPFVHRTFNTQSLTLGLIGGTAFAVAKLVSEVVFPEFNKMNDQEKFIHEGVKGFIVRLIFTQDFLSASFGAGIYMTAQGMTFVFEKTIGFSKPFAKEVFESFKRGFVIEACIRMNITESLIWGGARHGAAKTVSLLFKQTIMNCYNLKTDKEYDAYLSSYSKHLDKEIVDAFVVGFVRGFILNANPISALFSASINATATKTVQVYNKTDFQASAAAFSSKIHKTLCSLVPTACAGR